MSEAPGRALLAAAIIQMAFATCAFGGRAAAALLPSAAQAASASGFTRSARAESCLEHWLHPHASKTGAGMPRESQRVHASGSGTGWSPDFSIPAVDGYVACTTNFDDRVIIGGDFETLGEMSASNIAQWDGHEWSDLGGGVDGDVFALAEWHGLLIVGGVFRHAGAVDARGIASWNGSEWRALGNGLGGFGASSLHVMNDTLFAACDLSQGSAVFKWDGNSWSAVGDTLAGYIYTLSSHEGHLVAGGHLSFETVANKVQDVATLDGGKWAPLGEGINDPGHWYGDISWVDSFANYNGELVAGGYFPGSKSLGFTSLARWTGARWDSLPGSTSVMVTALLASGDSLLVGAEFTPTGGRTGIAARLWNGSEWTDIGEPLDGYVTGLTFWHGTIVAGGPFSMSDTHRVYDIAALNGASWEPLIGIGSRMHGLAAVSPPHTSVNAFTIYDDGLVAGGAFAAALDPSGWIPTGAVARWDGLRWQSIGDGGPDGMVNSLAVFHGDLYAGGTFDLADHPGDVQHIARWDGHAWSVPGNGVDGAVQSMAVYGDELFAAGWFKNAGTVAVDGLASWDGVEWRRAGLPQTSTSGSGILAMTVWNGQLVVGGYGAVAGVNTQGLAAWDGAEWKPIGGPVYYEVLSLLAVDDGLIVSGILTSLDVPWISAQVAKWDGNTLVPMSGTGWLSGLVSSLAMVNGRLYAGCNPSAGPTSDMNVARWDTVGWSALDGGVAGSANALIGYQGHLWVGGGFETAGGVGSALIARWDADAPPGLAPPHPQLQASSPNPFRTQTTISYELKAPARTRIEVFDLNGRRVDLIMDRVQPAGRHQAVWDASRNHAIRSGIYFARLEAGGESQTLRIALIQ